MDIGRFACPFLGSDRILEIPEAMFSAPNRGFFELGILSPELGTRIELVNGRDLLLGMARRRAVFLWRDMVRHGVRRAYAVQKWSNNGATHIPDRSEFRRAT
jgi:hypothetical protein